MNIVKFPGFNLELNVPKYLIQFGNIKIYMYAFCIVLGIIIGLILAKISKEKFGIKYDTVLEIVIGSIIFGTIGARLYYVLFRLEYYTNFWDIFKIWKGGLAFYGGLIGGAIAVLIYCAIHKKNFFALLDIVAPSLIFGQALGRWGNFFNQEAYGFYVDNPNLQWFPFSVFIDDCNQPDCACGGAGGWHLATFFYESMWNLITFAILITLLYKVKFKQK